MRINYRSFPWFDTDLVAQAVEVFRATPEIGRPTLSKVLRLSMFKSEKLLEIFRDHDLFQYLDDVDPVRRISEVLELDGPEPVDEDVELGDVAEDGQFEVPNQYHYDAGEDLYLVTIRIRGKDRTVRIPGEMHRAMRGAYSDWDGDRHTLNAVAKRFGVSRTWFQAYKTAMGWTHDSDPFSDEEVAEVDPEELAQRALQRRRLAIEKRYDRLTDEQDRKDAERLRRLEHLVLQPAIEDLCSRLPALEPANLVRFLPDLDTLRYAAVISPTDIHYGKHSPAGTVADPYDRDEAKRRLEAGTLDLLTHLARYGTPEEIIVPVGSDWFHVDNAQYGTTKGTRQDVDGHLWQMISGGTELALWLVETLRQAANRVRLVVVRGNHDDFSCLFLLKLLQVRYAGVEDVEVVPSVRQRLYLDYGGTLLGFTHGHHWKKDMVMKILTEPDRELLYRTSERIWFTGHRHHEESKDYGGVRWYQLPSLSGDDQWHEEKGYNCSRKALAGYVIEHDRGVTAQIFAPADIA